MNKKNEVNISNNLNSKETEPKKMSEFNVLIEAKIFRKGNMYGKY